MLVTAWLLFLLQMCTVKHIVILIYVNSVHFYRVMHLVQSAVLRSLVVCLSVCPSVRL